MAGVVLAPLPAPAGFVQQDCSVHTSETRRRDECHRTQNLGKGFGFTEKGRWRRLQGDSGMTEASCESASKNQVCVSGGEPGPSASTANTAPREGGVFTQGTEAQAEETTHAPWAPADSGELEDPSWLLQ